MTSADEASEEAIFRQFPKYRQPLPDEYLSIYDIEYVANLTVRGLVNNIARVLESWIHICWICRQKLPARDFACGNTEDLVKEFPVRRGLAMKNGLKVWSRPDSPGVPDWVMKS